MNQCGAKRSASHLERLIELHGYEVYVEAIEAANSGRGAAESERAYHLLLWEDDTEKEDENETV